jgi:hypothetical protein
MPKFMCGQPALTDGCGGAVEPGTTCVAVAQDVAVDRREDKIVRRSTSQMERELVG